MLHRLPAHTVQFYNDGPDAPWTPILAEAERAYGHAYSIGAWQTLRWQEPDDDLIEKLRMAPKAECQMAEVYVPSSFMFGDPTMDSEQIVYREGHDIDAALAHGKHQAVELSRQCWDELADRGFPEENIAPLVFRPWYEAVLKWATGSVEPKKISAAPRPEEFVPINTKMSKRRFPVILG